MTEKTPTTDCAWCGEPISEGEALAPIHGAAEHWECGLRAVAGGLNHQTGTCSCCGGSEPPDPPEMTRRQAAVAAADYYLHNSPWRRYIDGKTDA